MGKTGSLKRPLLSKSIQGYIRNYILENKLRSGEPLPTQGKISESLGVSRTAVREATQSLESLGMVEVRHGTGLFVRGANLDAVLDVLSYNLVFEPSNLLDFLRIRRLLESNIIPDVVKKIQPKDLEICWNILKTWEERVAARSSFTRQDQLFHQTLYLTIGNQLFVDLVGVFWTAYRNAESRMNLASRSPKRALDYHCRILEAVEEKNTALAKRLMFEHFQEGEDNLQLALKEGLDIPAAANPCQPGFEKENSNVSRPAKHQRG